MVYNGITFIITNDLQNFKQLYWKVDGGKYATYVGVSKDKWEKEKDQIIEWATNIDAKRKIKCKDWMITKGTILCWNPKNKDK